MSGTLLMIHGIGCGGEVWDVMRPGFAAAGWTCEAPTLFPDLRTIETPPESIAQLSFQDYVDDMARRCDRIFQATGEKPAVIGHSMGGLIAQKLVEAGKVSKAVFLTPAQPKGCSAPGLSILITFANVVLSGDVKKGHKIWKFGFRYGVLNCVDKSRHDELYALARYDSGQVYRDIADGVEVDEATFTVPTLTIAAGKDRATPAKSVRKMTDKYAGAPVPTDFIEYADHAHWIVDEPGTVQVVDDIADWLATH
ncbi:alpha/beta hydrolase [Ponticaulis profundi]|uniref:Alpha/beta hydrolase n=1 Tax=Ponticaulis profundi TaxID=2665222 RepID=A0ABW1S652_9PROT